MYVHSPQLSLSLRCFAMILSLYPAVRALLSDPVFGGHGCRGLGGCPGSTKAMLVAQEDDGAFIPSVMQGPCMPTGGAVVCCSRAL